MNDPAAPQTTPTAPSDQEKELADAALRETGILTDAPSEQPTPATTPLAADTPVSTPTIETESTVSTPSETETATPLQSETSSPVTPASSTPMPEIPVNDSTVTTPTEESVSASAPQVPPAAPSLDAASAPMGSESTPTGQAPVKQEGFFSRLLHGFKK